MKLTFPEIESVHSYKYVKCDDQTVTSIQKDCSCIISKEWCKKFQEKLGNCNGVYNAVEFNGKTLLLKDLDIYRRCHQLKDLKEKVNSEITWLCEEKYCIPPGCKRIDQKKLDIFN